MSQEAVERVLGRLLTDTWFRLRAADSLETVSMQEGYQLNATELRMLEGMDQSHIARFAERLDPGLCRSARLRTPQGQAERTADPQTLLCDRIPGPDAPGYKSQSDNASPTYPPGDSRLRRTL